MREVAQACEGDRTMGCYQERDRALLGSLPFPDGSGGNAWHCPPKKYSSSLGEEDALLIVIVAQLMGDKDPKYCTDDLKSGGSVDLL